MPRGRRWPPLKQIKLYHELVHFVLKGRDLPRRLERLVLAQQVNRQLASMLLL